MSEDNGMNEDDGNKYTHGWAFEGYAIKLSRAFGFLYEYEVLALQVLARSLGAGAKIVNIGAGAGTSALAMKEARPDSMMWTIDISKGHPTGGMENEYNAFQKVNMLDQLPIQILGDSSEIGRTWGTEPLPGVMVDMVFVDGGHSPEVLTKDIDAWFPWVRDNGIMAFHDYHPEFWSGLMVVIDNHQLLVACPTLFVVESLIVKRITREGL